MHMVQYRTFDLGPFALQKGTVLPDAKIVYATVGRLNDAKDNVVLVPTWGSGSPEDVVGLLIGTARALNPEKYFIQSFRRRLLIFAEQFRPTVRERAFSAGDDLR
jgi:homoserine acetyltransferase